MAREDEKYIVDLCDAVLHERSLRQHRFDFLRGDPGKTGRCICLPVDAYYPKKNLVIEYHEQQHTQAVKHFDKRKTVSGVSRGQQRRIYDARRVKVLRQNGIKLIILSYFDFSHKGNKRLTKDKKSDLSVIKNHLRELYEVSLYQAQPE